MRLCSDRTSDDVAVWLLQYAASDLGWSDGPRFFRARLRSENRVESIARKRSRAELLGDVVPALHRRNAVARRHAAPVAHQRSQSASSEH